VNHAFKNKSRFVHQPQVEKNNIQLLVRTLHWQFIVGRTKAETAE